MATFTTAAEGRKPDSLALKYAEAVGMLSAGFRFAEFNPEGDRYQVSVPYRVAHNLLKDIITTEQR
jgi:hypothetical protein